MSNSNQIIRNRTIGKAILFTVLPMIFSGMGGYLFQHSERIEVVSNDADINSLNQELIEIKKQDSLLIDALTNLNTHWIAYFDAHFKYIEGMDSISAGKVRVDIQNAEDLFWENISQTKKLPLDLPKATIFKLFDKRFDDYFKDMTQYRTFKDRLENHETSGECCDNMEDLEDSIDALESEKRDLLSRITNCEERIRNRDDRLEAFREQNQGQLREINNLNSQLSEVEARIYARFRDLLARYRGDRLNDSKITIILTDLGSID